MVFLQDILHPSGSPECPCVTTEWDSSVFCNDTSSGSCIPRGFGQGCKQHSLYLDERCYGVPEIPKWCYVAWCYVDNEKCFTSNFEYKREEGIRFKDGDLFYSFETCGPFKPEWGTASFDAKTHPSNFVFDGVIPAPEYPWSYLEDENGEVIDDLDTESYWNGTGTYKGAIIDYIDELTLRSAFGGFDLMPRSKGSDSRQPNSKYTASVTDISNKISHVGVGNYWITSERAAMVKYTIPLYYSPFYLYELNYDLKKGLWEGINNISAPFTDNLCYAIVGCLLLVGIATVVFLTPRGDTANLVETLNAIQSLRISKLHKHFLKFRVHSTVIFFSCMKCFEGAAEPQGQSTSLPNKVLAFGFGFFCLITHASYTANLASDLSRRGITGFIPNMKTVEEQNLIICAPWPLKNEFEYAWPDVKFLFIHEIPYISSGIERLKSKDCAAMAAEHTEIMTIVDVCDPNKEGKAIIASIEVPILEVPIAFPIAIEHSSFLSNAILNAQINGVDFLQILARYHRNGDCDVYPKKFYKNVENEPLTVSDIGGAFAALTICIAFGVCCKTTKGKFCKKVGKEYKKRMSGVVLADGTDEKCT